MCFYLLAHRNTHLKSLLNILFMFKKWLAVAQLNLVSYYALCLLWVIPLFKKRMSTVCLGVCCLLFADSFKHPFNFHPHDFILPNPREVTPGRWRGRRGMGDEAGTDGSHLLSPIPSGSNVQTGLSAPSPSKGKEPCGKLGRI